MQHTEPERSREFEKLNNPLIKSKTRKGNITGEQPSLKDHVSDNQVEDPHGLIGGGEINDENSMQTPPNDAHLATAQVDPQMLDLVQVENPLSSEPKKPIMGGEEEIKIEAPSKTQRVKALEESPLIP